MSASIFVDVVRLELVDFIASDAYQHNHFLVYPGIYDELFLYLRIYFEIKVRCRENKKR